MSARCRCRSALAWGALPLVAACAGPASAPPRNRALPTLTLQRLASREESKRAAEARAPARSHLLGAITRKSIGPFLARAKDGGVVVWIAAAEGGVGSGAELVVVPLGTDGAPLAPPRVVAAVPREATSLLVRPTGNGRGGWQVVWSALLDRGESLTFLELDADGTARGAPRDLQRTTDHVTWAELVPTTRGTLCIWAEEAATGDANILAAPIDSEGKPHGMPVRVARRVERWAVVRAGEGAGLALVSREKTGAAGVLSWLRLDAEGGALGMATAVGKEAPVSGAIEVAPFQDQWLLAWTDRTGEDPQVMVATVDAAGHVQGPARAMNAVGGSSLVALAAGTVGVALAWESPHGRARPSNLLHLASVTRAGGGLAAQPITSFEAISQTPREFIPTDDGFALLATPARWCVAGENPGSSPANDAIDCSVVPTFIRYDEHLAPIQTEPLIIGGTGAPITLAWGLRCNGERCAALASTADAPTPVFAIDLPRRKSPFAAPTPAASPAGDGSRVTGVVTLASGQACIDVAAARVGDATLVATMTNSGPSAHERKRGGDATIRLRAFDEDGRGLDAGNTLTTRSVPTGRVAIAAAPPPEGDAVAAWVAQDDGDPQVHVARLDGRGHRGREVQLTTEKGDASSVAIAWAGDGWLVAWVDSRDGNGEVYTTKIDRKLNRVAPDRRITRAPGDATDVSLAVGDDVAWLAWSDPRESPREGLGDVYVTQLRPRDALRMGDEVRLLSTAAHSRSPVVAVSGAGAVVVWIEDGPTGLDAPGAAMMAQLAANGRVAGSPAAIALGGEGRPTAIALAKSAHGSEVIVARSSRGGVTLDALELSGDGSAGPTWPVLDLDAPAPFDVLLALAGGALVYDDIGSEAGRYRVRRVTISW